jgi:Periplasmic binding protein
MSPGGSDAERNIVRKSIVGLVALLISMTGLLQLGAVSAADAAQNESGTGVTAGTITVGITEVDTAAIASIIDINDGDPTAAYGALIKQINADGGINGRKIVPVYVQVDPIGTAPAAAACTQLTEDDHVFMALGFFQAADTACYVTGHDTPIIGESLSAMAAAAAVAPWYNPELSDTDLIPKEMAAFQGDGAFAGKKVGVVGSSVDADEMNEVIPALHKVKADVVQVATSAVPSSDTNAMTSEYQVIAQKFQQAGVNVVVAVGDAGEQFPDSLQNIQSTYLPRIIDTDEADFEAYSTSTSSQPQVYFKNALTAGGLAPANVTWEADGMQKCVDIIRKADPSDQIGNPLTASASAPMTWGYPELACQQLGLMTDLLKAAGKTVNPTTLAKGANTLTHVTLPGSEGFFNFSHGHNDGDGPAYIFEWSNAQDKMVLKQTVN